jgi:hypothetical protein
VRVGQAAWRLTTIGVGIVVIGVVSATVSAAPALGPPTGWPDLAAAVVAPTSFPAGAKVSRQGYVKPASDSLAEYDRVFKELTVKLNGQKLLDMEDDVSIGKTASDAQTLIVALPLGLLLESTQIGKEFTKASGVKTTYVKVGKPTTLGIGDDSVVSVIRIGTRFGEFRFVFAALRIGQIDSAYYFVGTPRQKLGIAEAKVLGRLSLNQIKTAMVPQSTVLPTISGSAAIGQTLGAVPGTWLGFPTAFTYQWERCDGTGSNCVAIVGATSQSYIVSEDDANATLRLLVGTQNPYGVGTATTAQSAVVAPPPPPPPGP